MNTLNTSNNLITDPNFDCSWDQKIPNEPIYERNHLLHQPAIIPSMRPINTNYCTRSQQPWTSISRADERHIANWWLDNVHKTGKERPSKHAGISTKQRSNHTLKTLTEQYTNKPWINGNHIDIVTESHLRNSNYHNPHDQIEGHVTRDIDILSSIRNKTFIKDMVDSNQRPIDEMKLWGNSTSPRMLEPY
uniref:Uncharacterized protein n=1 Tax=viral metagenome TaxID=1070528 RepID=A0A6C0J572_9ZZZZ